MLNVHKLEKALGSGDTGGADTASAALKASPATAGATNLLRPFLARRNLDKASPKLNEVVTQDSEAGSEMRRFQEALVHALLEHQPHDQRAPSGRDVKGSLGAVLRAEEFMVANCARAIGPTDLFAVTGVTLRSLQLAFRHHRGTTPTAFLRECRLEMARARLLDPTRVSVTTVALECGFNHLGRFSQRYRERFGERPNDTVSRHRRRTPPDGR